METQRMDADERGSLKFGARCTLVYIEADPGERVRVTQYDMDGNEISGQWMRHAHLPTLYFQMIDAGYIVGLAARKWGSVIVEAKSLEYIRHFTAGMTLVQEVQSP